jgi:hypothetical protein
MNSHRREVIRISNIKIIVNVDLPQSGVRSESTYSDAAIENAK